MAGQVFLTIYHQGNAFQHSVVFDKGDPASWVHEFEHQVLYLGNKPFFDKAPIRVHKPVRLYIPIDKTIPSLIQKVIQGEAVEKVMLRWFRYQEKTKSDSEYFRHIFETASFDQCRFVMPDVKNPFFDRYDHALELSFRYKKVTWIYSQGNLMVSDEWHGSEFEDGEEEEVEEEEEETTEEEVAPAEPVEDTSKKVTLSEAKFLPEEGKTDFNQKCNLTVKIAYIQETTKKKVLFKLFSAYNNNTQDMQHEIEAFESGGKADAAVTLHYNDEYYSDTAKPADASVEYFVKVSHPEADEVESERLKLPFKKQQTVQFIEIPDVLFNHNSAVPMIDTDEKLINAVKATLDFAGKNPDKEATIYGHTDSSGETDYNITLSELRCKSVKAFIDNKPQDFVSICKEKSKVEDYQTFLSVLTKKYSWECDPGSIDNQDGPKTKVALKQFQIDYNLFYSKSIAEDGKIGPETWEAFFNVIMERIRRNATAESGDSAPQLKCGKNNGIYPCGEKYAQDAYAKKGRKSQKDRRVEIVFNDPSVPIEDTPYVDMIVMEPIDIVADKPEKKITGMVMWCSHIDDGKKRIAYWGHTLEIVPDIITSDTVTLQAQPTKDDFSVNWRLSGYKKTQLTGHTVKIPVSGLKAQAGDFILNYFTGQLRKLIPPQQISVRAIDESSNIVQGKISVYPGNSNTFEWNLKKKWSEVYEIMEKIKNGCSFLGEERKRFTPSFFEGKLTFSAGWKEDPSNNNVYLAASVKGGFQPLIGLEFRQPIPIKGIASYIPAKLLNYGANIEAYFALAGNISLTASLERNGTDDFKGAGEVGGSLSGSLGISAIVGNGKILKVDAEIGTGVSAFGQIYILAEDKADQFKCQAAIEAKWDGVKGAISWQVFDGKWSGKYDCVFASEQPLWKSNPPITIFPR